MTNANLAHTPGPWRRGSDSHRSKELWSEVYSNGYLVATAHLENSLARDRTSAVAMTRANANLIAAAPDLLDALKSFTSKYDGHDLDAYLVSYQAVIHQARAAIAKATGAQQ